MLSIRLQIPVLEKTIEVTFEHSLNSIAKWEGLWEKTFLSREDKKYEEIMSYIECMMVKIYPDVSMDPSTIVKQLKEEDVIKIINYIRRPMTALKFKEEKKGGMYKTKTAEYYYYLMFGSGIPLECENWNFERLVALLRYMDNRSNVKNKKHKGLTSKELMRRNDLNEKRIKEMGWSNG